jgi:hypothetical protein
MVPNDFVALKHQEPFRPFRVILVDGQAYDVVHHQLMMVGVNDLMIGLPRSGSDKPYFERLVWVAYPQIKQVDMLDADKALQTR